MSCVKDNLNGPLGYVSRLCQPRTRLHLQRFLEWKSRAAFFDFLLEEKERKHHAGQSGRWQTILSSLTFNFTFCPPKKKPISWFVIVEVRMLRNYFSLGAYVGSETEAGSVFLCRKKSREPVAFRFIHSRKAPLNHKNRISSLTQLVCVVPRRKGKKQSAIEFESLLKGNFC